MPGRLLLSTALVLLAATAIVSLPSVRFIPADERAPVISIDSQNPGWNSSGCGVTPMGAGAFNLTSSPQCPAPWAAINIPQNASWDAVLVSVQVTALNIRPGPAEFQRPAAGPEVLNSANRIIYRDFNPVLRTKGSRPSRPWKRLFHLATAPLGEHLRIRFLMAAEAGSLLIEKATTTVLITRPVFTSLRLTIVAAWIVWLAVAAWATFRSCRNRRVALSTAIITLALVAGANLPRSNLRDVVDTARRAAGLGSTETNALETTSEPIWRSPLAARRAAKVNHLLGFVFFTAGLVLARPKGDLVTVSIAVLILALGTELAQGLTATRTPRIIDIAIDLAGACIGMALALAINRIRKRRSSTKRKTRHRRTHGTS